MKLVRFLLFSFASLALLATGQLQSNCEAQIREVRSIFLNDLGVVREDRSGNPYVTINPVRCRQLGPQLCEFFKQHEYGHVNLDHFGRGTDPQRAEAEADCYAARHVSASIAQAAIDWFNAGNGASSVHGTSQQRAARVARCMGRSQSTNLATRSIQQPVSRTRSTSTASASPQQTRTENANGTTTIRIRPRTTSAPTVVQTNIAPSTQRTTAQTTARTTAQTTARTTSQATSPTAQKTNAAPTVRTLLYRAGTASDGRALYYRSGTSPTNRTLYLRNGNKVRPVTFIQTRGKRRNP